MKKIEKVITRDLQFVDLQVWFNGYAVGLKKWLGWGYSDSIFHIHDRHIDFYRIPEEHQIIFRDKVLEKINEEKFWYVKESKKTSKLLKEIYAFFDQADQTAKSADNKQLSDLYIKYKNYVEAVMGPFLVAYWLPNWLEKDKNLSQDFAEEISLAIEQRKETEHIFPRGGLLINSIMDKVANQLKLKDGLEWFIDKDELESFLIDGKAPSIEILKMRKGGFIFSKNGVNFTNNTANDLKKIFNFLGYDFDIIEIGGKEEIKGQPACQGVARGKVRIILSKKDISTLIQGEVLVASMTTPEYLPAMKKSVAFVTDEGGITCHAAIVARELGKPCIIGTKIATKVLKDGDMVEVDADKGIVKIIK